MTHYDPSYDTTVALVLPVLFVTFAIDLGITKRPDAPRNASALLTVVVLLVCGELLALTAIRQHHELTTAAEVVVDGALLFTGGLIFWRVANPLLLTIANSWFGAAASLACLVLGIVLVILWTLDTIKGQTVVIIFALSVLVLGYVLPGAVGDPVGRVRGFMAARDPDGDEQPAAIEVGRRQSSTLAGVRTRYVSGSK
jgi:hypothetical protein